MVAASARGPQVSPDDLEPAPGIIPADLADQQLPVAPAVVSSHAQPGDARQHDAAADQLRGLPVTRGCLQTDLPWRIQANTPVTPMPVVDNDQLPDACKNPGTGGSQAQCPVHGY